MKYRAVKDMLAKPDTIDADDIAKYAVFNTTDNDSKKSLNICDLICAYTGSVISQQTASLEARVKELEEETATLKRKLKIAENTYWNEID